MGCKVENTDILGQFILDLIETYWDVKFVRKENKVYTATDLIETYWDVKIFQCLQVENGQPDLIETYWDVKISVLDN